MAVNHKEQGFWQTEPQKINVKPLPCLTETLYCTAFHGNDL